MIKVNLHPHVYRALALASLSASLFAGCKKKAAADAEEKPEVIVQVEHPETGPITDEISADATLFPVAQAAILPKVTAPVRKFFVQRGSHVSAGQLVAQLENQDLQAAAIDNQGAYDAAKGTYTNQTQIAVTGEATKSRTDLAQAKATLDLQNTILKSREQLLAQGAIPGRDVDTARASAVQAQAAYDVALEHFNSVTKSGTSASLEQAKGTLASARGKYLGAEAQLSYTQIRSPISGVVTERPLFVGETAAAGTPIVTVMDTSSVIAKLHIAQAQAQELKLGAGATMTVAGMDDPVAAKVSLISPALDPGSTTVEVWLTAANPEGKLKPGTPVHVSVTGRTIPNALLVPTEAIQRSSEGAGKIVMLMTADGKAKKKTVLTGIQGKAETQILDGLSPGDTVITGNSYGLDDGTKVKIGPAEKKDDDDAKPGAAKDDDDKKADPEDDRKAPAAKKDGGKQ